MAERDFPCFMLHTKAATHRKLRRFTDSEWRAYVGGVLALAAESPVRGALLVAEGVPVEAEDVAGHANVSLVAARSALTKARRLGLVVGDSGHEVIRDWAEWNPTPKPRKPSDTPEQRRDRQRRSRAKPDDVTPPDGRDGGVTDEAVTPPEGKGREVTPPQEPPEGGHFPTRPEGKRGRDLKAYEDEVTLFVAEHFPGGKVTVGAAEWAAGQCRQNHEPEDPDNMRRHLATLGYVSLELA